MSIDHESLIRIRDSAEQLYSQEEVERALDRLAARIATDIGDTDPLLISVMTGGLVTSSELFTRLQCPIQLDYLHATRYDGTKRARNSNGLPGRHNRSLAERCW